MLKRNWIWFLLLLFVFIKVSIGCLTIFLSYRAGEMYTQTYDYEYYAFFSYLSSLILSIIFAVSCLIGMLVGRFKRLQYVTGKLFILFVFIIVLEFVNLNFKDLRNYYFLTGFTKTIATSMPINEIEEWVNHTELPETEDLLVSIEEKDIPIILQSVNPQYVSIYNNNNKKAVRLSYGKGIRPIFGVIVFSSNMSKTKRNELMIKEFEQIDSNTYIWFRK